MTTRWMPALLMVAMTMPAWVRADCQTQGHFPLTAHLVAQALTAHGIETADDQVSLLAMVVASEPSPLLDVLSIEPIADQATGKRRVSRSLVKLGCRSTGTCLPFYSIVSGVERPGENATDGLSAAAGTGVATRRESSRIIIRAGAHATLVMDDKRAHVEVAVVSLENGAAGHTIRVASPDHKLVYRAEVVSANLLRRSF